MQLFCRLSQCCCGFSLKAGSWAIAILYLISSISSIVLVSIHANKLKNLIDTKDTSKINPYTMTVAERQYGFFIFLAVADAVSIGFHILLLVGLSQAQVKKILIWLVYSVVLIALKFAGLIILSIILLAYHVYIGLLPIFLLGFPVLGLSWYFISVIHSHYSELKGYSANVP